MAYLVPVAFTFLNVLGAVLPSDTFSRTGKSFSHEKSLANEKAFQYDAYRRLQRPPLDVHTGGGGLGPRLNKFEQVSIYDHQMLMGIPGRMSEGGGR